MTSSNLLATLASTGRLMDRIVALRKDCIKGLGIRLLHRAYELLDEEKDEDRLQVSLEVDDVID